METIFTEEQLLENANYIFSILKTNKPYLMSWGFEKPCYTVYKDMMAFKFTVHGYVHSGYVYVTYNGGADTFEVYTVKFDGKLVSSKDDVYFNQLIDTIDRMVERGDCSQAEYELKVKKTYGL